MKDSSTSWYQCFSFSNQGIYNDQRTRKDDNVTVQVNKSDKR